MSKTKAVTMKSGYSEVNGLKMYYEIHGTGKPLVLIHGGGSTIKSAFGRIIPLLEKKRQIIGMELQAHGHTNDRDTFLSFAQDAEDIAALLKNLEISKADFLGFSNGGQTLIELALRYPQLVGKLILASTFYKRDAAAPEFWAGFEGAKIEWMPQVLKDAYLEANNSESGLLNMFNRDVQRMQTFQGWEDEQLRSITAPALVINGNKDVASLEHAVEMCKTIPNCELVVFPGGHGDYLGTVETLRNGKWPEFNSLALIEDFLDN